MQRGELRVQRSARREEGRGVPPQLRQRRLRAVVPRALRLRRRLPAAWSVSAWLGGGRGRTDLSFEASLVGIEEGAQVAFRRAELGQRRLPVERRRHSGRCRRAGALRSPTTTRLHPHGTAALSARSSGHDTAAVSCAQPWLLAPVAQVGSADRCQQRGLRRAVPRRTVTSSAAAGGEPAIESNSSSAAAAWLQANRSLPKVRGSAVGEVH